MSEQPQTPRRARRAREPNPEPKSRQTRQRKTPYILSSLLSSVHRVAYNNKYPQNFNGLVFFNADKHKEDNSYHILMKNCDSLNDDQLARIIAIINETHEKKDFTFEKPKRQVGMNIVMNNSE